MLVIPIKTRIMMPPKDDLWEVLDAHLPKLKEQDIVVVTSKIVSIGEGRCVRAGTEKQKQELIEQEADYLALFQKEKHSMFSIKRNAVVGSAGIDDSNGNGYWILWPKDPIRSAKEIWTYLRSKKHVRELGVIITDSYCPPLRLGALGISIGFFGFHPALRHVGKPDIFGRKFKFSCSNLVDGIAAAAVMVMGETIERIPLALVRDIPRLRFVGHDTSRELLIRPTEDIYSPLFKPLYEGKKQKAKVHTPRGNQS